MKLVNSLSREMLEKFFVGLEHAPFQQSWEWGEFQVACGKRIWRLGVEEDGKLIAAATLVKVPLPLGFSYFYCPKGPILEMNNEKLIMNNEVLKFLFLEIQKLAQAEKSIFLRFEPKSSIQDSFLTNKNGLHASNEAFRIQASIDIQPAKTLILDLSKPEDELLAEMHSKTRYNIRLAEKKGVRVVEAGVGRFDEFWRLMEKTCERDGFRLHGKRHYQKLISSFQNDFNLDDKGNLRSKEELYIKLFFAEHEGRVIVGNIAAFFGDTATYVHGASDNEYRNTMAAYLIQWHLIKLAKKLGYRYYDLYGIDEAKWPGVTRFKLGFGGKTMEYPGTFDAVFKAISYEIYKLARKVRRAV